MSTQVVIYTNALLLPNVGHSDIVDGKWNKSSESCITMAGILVAEELTIVWLTVTLSTNDFALGFPKIALPPTMYSVNKSYKKKISCVRKHHSTDSVE